MGYGIRLTAEFQTLKVVTIEEEEEAPRWVENTQYGKNLASVGFSVDIC